MGELARQLRADLLQPFPKKFCKLYAGWNVKRDITPQVLTQGALPEAQLVRCINLRRRQLRVFARALPFLEERAQSGGVFKLFLG